MVVGLTARTRGDGVGILCGRAMLVSRVGICSVASAGSTEDMRYERVVC